MAEVDHVSMRGTEMRLHATKAEDDVAVALARDVLARVERLFERDSHSALETPLKIVRTRPRFVSAHSRRAGARLGDCSVGLVDVLARIDCTEARKHMKSVLSEADAFVFEANGVDLTFVATKEAILLRHPDDTH